MTFEPTAAADIDVDDLADPVVAIDADAILRYANRAASRTLGWEPSELLGRKIIDLIHPDDLNLALAAMVTITTKDVGELITIRIRTSFGSWLALELRGAQQPWKDESLTVLVARTTQDRAALDLDQGSVDVLRSVMANMHGMVALVNPDLTVRSINGAITRLLGHDPELAPGHAFIEFIHPDDRGSVLEVLEQLRAHSTAALEARFLTTEDGQFARCEFTVSNMCSDSTLEAYIISGQVSAALADARERVEFLADHDNRTGLLNRDGFMKGALDLIRRGGGGLGLMIIDIARFRSINDLYGDRVGDAVLTTLAQRIDDIRWPDIVTSRFGGDEFVVAVRSPSSSAIEMLGERVRREVARPVLVDGQEISLSIRTATAFDARPRDLEALLATASAELMSAKSTSTPDPAEVALDTISEQRQQLEQLRNALEAGDVTPYFQPIVAPDGRVIAVEALIRWAHPVRGVLGVGEILPLAEMAGLTDAVGEQVLDRTLDFAARLDDAGHPDIEVHVNVDPKHMARAGFATDFVQRCNDHRAQPSQVVVEISETDLLAPGAMMIENMHELRRAGIHVSIDDFGTGYSSLSHLLELPVDGVKIDRRFVAGLDVDRAATNLTTAIIGLSASLQLACVAAGVEQPYQLQRLVSMGCQAFQGWLFSPAMAAEELLSILPRLDISHAAVVV